MCLLCLVVLACPLWTWHRVRNFPDTRVDIGRGWGVVGQEKIIAGAKEFFVVPMWKKTNTDKKWKKCVANHSITCDHGPAQWFTQCVTLIVNFKPCRELMCNSVHYGEDLSKGIQVNLMPLDECLLGNYSTDNRNHFSNIQLELVKHNGRKYLNSFSCLSG